MSLWAHLDLDVLFERSGDGYRARVVRSPAGEGQFADFAPPVTALELENLALKIGWQRGQTRGRQQAPPVAAAKQLGGLLFGAAFTGTVGECLRRSAERATDQDASLRIRLRLSACPELADLPWELLYDASDDWFLALSGTTPVIRHMDLPTQARAVPVTLPLRVLAIRSEPDGVRPLDLAAEWEQVTAAISGLTGAGAIAVTELAEPTLKELRRALATDKFHVLHYMGHGIFDAQRGGALVFADQAGRADLVTAEKLGVLLHGHSSMRLAIINACEAARTDPVDPFAGIADTLVRRGIPAVIAMQFEISDQAAIEFTPALYGALAAGWPIDIAVAEARKAIYTVSPVEWATPVLYLRADDARLFDVAQPVDRTVSDIRAAATAAHTDKPDPLTTATRHADDGDLLLKQRDYAATEIAYREAIRLDPTNALTHNNLGNVLYNLKRYPDAEAAYREAIRLNPANALMRRNLGNVLYDLKRYPDAEAAYREAIRLDPTNAKAHNNLGNVLYNLKRYPDAEAAYREAIRLDPTYAMAHSNLGSLLADLRRYPEAEAAYREAIRLDPTCT